MDTISEITSDESAIALVVTLLQEWGLEEATIKNFEENKITIECLTEIREAEIKELIPSIKDRILFKAKLEKYLNVINDTASEDLTTSDISAPSSPASSCSYTSRCSSVETNHNSQNIIDIASILKDNSHGRLALAKLKINKKLDDSGRTYLTKSIIEYYVKTKESMKKEDFISLANSIVHFIPTEHKETYYIPPINYKNKTIPARGKLVDRYNNQRRILKREGILIKKRKLTIPEYDHSEDDDIDNIDAKIDAVALGFLKETDISLLIPAIGDRVKFQANLSMWKEDNETVKVNRNSSVLFIDISFNQVIDDVPETSKETLEVVNFHDLTDCQSHPDRDKIKSILEESYRGRALLKSKEGTKGLLDSSQRKELAHLIIDSVLDKNPSAQLTWANFQSWARGIGELFPSESPALYYASYIAGGTFQAKRNASGILYNTYLRKRKIFIKKKITVPFRKRRLLSEESSELSSDTESRKPCPIDLSVVDEKESEHVEEALLAITIAIEGATPWHEIEKYWEITTKTRVQKLYNEKGTLLDYLNEYQVLRGPNGYKLMKADFDRIYPATGDNILYTSLEIL